MSEGFKKFQEANKAKVDARNRINQQKAADRSAAVGSTTASNGKSFTEKLDAASMKYFVEVARRPFSQQAVAFLNAYWTEVQSEAEFIYVVAWDVLKYADMHSKGISLVYKYEEGFDLDFDIGLYFYEQMCKYCDDPKNKAFVQKYPRSLPVMMTAIDRKRELREEVDVNFDGRISFLEYLLYQYKDVANPGDFCYRSMGQDEHPEVRKARLALEEVNKRIRAFEEEKSRLTEESKGQGVKALGATNMLAQIESGPLKEELNKALISAEAAIRIATKKYGGGVLITNADGKQQGGSSDGALWWLNRDLEEKKKRYGPRQK